MTNITIKGVTTLNANGEEQYETFTRKVGGKSKKYYQYDYRHTDGELFSCVKPSLDLCRDARNEWLQRKAVS